jgi:hypothetical protein
VSGEVRFNQSTTAMKRTLNIVGLVAISFILAGLFVFNQQRARQREEASRQAAEQAANGLPRPTGPAVRGQRFKDRELKDPLAREALQFVGADIASTEIWSRAINNRDLPTNERKDLIEDLNEDGFRDPKNLTHEDLPLILSRIELIELLAPSAVDDVNAAAFQEAHKDLIAMRDRVLSRPPPPAGPVAGRP